MLPRLAAFDSSCRKFLKHIKQVTDQKQNNWKIGGLIPAGNNYSTQMQNNKTYMYLTIAL